MPDLPVVEELLEKGARALVGEDSIFEWEDVSPYAKARMRERAADVLDAVFPGWREGITRELSARHGDKRFHAGDALNAQYCAARTCSGCVLESRLVVHGPWVPVEEGTDG